MLPETTDRDRLLTLNEVKAFVPKSKTTIYRWIKQGRFPQQVKKCGASRTFKISSKKQAIQIIRPCLHHPDTFGQIFRAVVCAAHLVSFHMGKLAFNNIRTPALFI